MAGLLKELWIDLLIGDVEEFFQNDVFLSHGMNMSYAVENDRINFAYKGPRPGVTKNFRTDGSTELDVFMRTDTPEYLDLDNYSTDQFVLPRVDLFALPYDKKASLMEDSRMALVDAIATEGMWQVGPASNTAKTPVIAAATANANAGDGYDAITAAEILTLRVALDQKYPGLKNKMWYLVMDVQAYWYLVSTNSILAEQYKFKAGLGNVLSGEKGGNERKPIPLEIYNFMIWCDDRTPWYQASDSTKLAYDAASPNYTDGTDFKSAFAYVPNLTFCTALGSTEMFSQDKHPGKQSDLASFLTRAYIGPWGQTASNFKHAGAILRKPN